MIAARRLDEGPHGPVYERSFVGFRRDAEVEAALDSATRFGALVEFKIEGGALVTRRRWFESKPLDQLFLDADDAERRRNSSTVFSRLWQELSRLANAGCAHGAVHPANVLVANGGLQLVDAVANTTRLGFGDARLSQGWLWGARRPEAVPWAEWDGANLLRMATLLGLPTHQNVRAEAAASIFARCEAWAANAMDALPSGSDVGRGIELALDAAKRIVGALGAAPQIPVSLGKRDVVLDVALAPLRHPEIIRPPPPRPNPAVAATITPPPAESEDEVVRVIAESTFRGAAGLRMLHKHREDQLVQIAEGRGVPAARARTLLTHWLRRGGYVREAELFESARVSVRAGTQFHVWVPRNVLMNAQRTFTQYGVSPQEAEDLVATVLRELGLSDEREGERKWHPSLDAYVGKNCPKRTFSPKQRAEMCAHVASFGVPLELAEQVTKRYLDENKFVERAGWFG